MLYWLERNNAKRQHTMVGYFRLATLLPLGLGLCVAARRRNAGDRLLGIGPAIRIGWPSAVQYLGMVG